MVRAKGGPDASGNPERRTGAGRLSKEMRAAMSPAVIRAWQRIAPNLPPQLYLGGGTGAALYLHHRVSRDLDFFYHGDAVDLDALERQLTALGAVVDLRAPGTLRVYLGEAKVEFLHADEAGAQHQIEPPTPMAGVPVASLKDLMAMKLKVLAERGELRDYYDVKEMDERGGVSVEEGVALFGERYGIDRASASIRHLILALGYLGDCDEDESLPISKAELQAWWQRRQVQVVRNLDT